MSNIYIQEPPTSGKVLLKTSVGDIDIELWCRETPKTCRNFIQLCMEGYYNNTLFHRLVAGFIVQGGDPNGDGTGGESVYGGTFKDEFHSRLRFIRRGLVAMANAGRDDNGSQFFFTLGEATELQNKHTLFGKVTGDTVFNMLKLEDGVGVDHNEKPLFPHRILKTEVLLNPFDDIVPRAVERKRGNKEKKKKEKGVKNFGLLSFGSEAEEDEEQTNEFVQKTAGKAKSMHDVVDDPKLSKDTETFVKIEKEDDIDVPVSDADMDEDRAAAIKDAVRNKLQQAGGSKKWSKDSDKTAKKTSEKPVQEKKKTTVKEVVVSDSGSDEFGNELERERRIKRKKDADDIRDQINSLKKEYQKDKREKDAAITQTQQKSKAAAAAAEDEANAEPKNKMVQLYMSEQRKYADRKLVVPKKKDSAAHEQQTLDLLARFKSKLSHAMYASSDDEDGENAQSKKPKPAENDQEDDIDGDDWLSHTLHFEEKAPVLAKDASTKKDDWYDAFDPRNPLNQRKRGGDEKRSGGGGGGSSSRRREAGSSSSHRTGGSSRK